MGKRFYRLWPELISFENLYVAYRKAARGKRGKPAAAGFEYCLEENLIALQQELQEDRYQPGPYTSFPIRDPKRRLISAAPFRDRVVHHALVNVIEPLFERRFIYDTYANRKGKGTHRALDRCTRYLRRHAYVLPLDVRQFFPSIDHAILRDTLATVIGDGKVLDLCGRIIASGEGVLSDEYDMVYFSGDDLFAVNRLRGLPIGNLTSQFWANVYLDPLDHFIKRKLRCPGYVRYVDDMLLFGNDKQALREWCDAIVDVAAGLRLSLHENRAQSRPVACGVPFLGFQVFPDHRRLKRRKAVQGRRRLKHTAMQVRQGELSADRLKASVQGWVNHARYGDTWGLRCAVLADVTV